VLVMVELVELAELESWLAVGPEGVVPEGQMQALQLVVKQG
jgi:hypothetical protein